MPLNHNIPRPDKSTLDFNTGTNDAFQVFVSLVFFVMVEHGHKKYLSLSAAIVPRWTGTVKAWLPAPSEYVNLCWPCRPADFKDVAKTSAVTTAVF
jgi:hypothetical protein